jgi:hypothetical protein
VANPDRVNKPGVGQFETVLGDVAAVAASLPGFEERSP